MEKETPKQQVLVPYDFSKAAENALVCAIELASLFKCEITVFHALNKKNIRLYADPDDAEKIVRNKLIALAKDIIENDHILVNVYVFRDEADIVVNKIYERINAIAMIAGLNPEKQPTHYFSPGSVVTDFRNLRIPIIVVHDILPRKSLFSGMILPLDFNRESKEKAAWVGHISTLNKTSVRILTRHYKDTYFAASLRNNLALVMKLYKNLNVDYRVVCEAGIKSDIDKYAVDYAWYNNGEMIVLMATKELAADDLLFGLKEKKIIANKYKLPIMLINPRDDLYLPCGC
ncbi:MAG TPA: universal stress protein [Bacteroidales bacterium]|nr:universal stress protein [Bacteroidales bacterium]